MLRDKIATVQQIDLTADELVSALMALAASENVCILDSCGAGHLGSHLMIAGINPVETIEISNDDPEKTLRILDERLTGDLASIFTLSYDFGRKLSGTESKKSLQAPHDEPDLFLASFDVLLIHDYDSGETGLTGNAGKFDTIRHKLEGNILDLKFDISNKEPQLTSNFTKSGYLAAIETINEHIRRGDTYQTNLTQQLSAKLPANLTPEIIFHRLRRNNPSPFSAFLKRKNSSVVSASPERFFRIDNDRRTITTSPIKGTRPRGKTIAEDKKLLDELLTSQKDRAENTMIVDLIRNDLGRVCEYGSIRVDKLCDLEQHPTLFHLVSTVTGDLRAESKISDILKAVFPCGSITGAPKISTMKIIDEIETVNRGLSMGAIGYYIPKNLGEMAETLDLNVAIRTMTIRGNTATFNVGGGIVIDSDPESEYEETLTKAKALLNAIGAISECLL